MFITKRQFENCMKKESVINTSFKSDKSDLLALQKLITTTWNKKDE